MIRTVLWTLAALLFGVGDVTTTYYGLVFADAHEANPVARHILDSGGALAMVGTKLGFFALVAVFYVAARDTHPRLALVLPAILVVSGAGLTTWNLFVITIA